MTVPSDDKFDSSCHLIVKDVAIDNPKLPTQWSGSPSSNPKPTGLITYIMPVLNTVL